MLPPPGVAIAGTTPLAGSGVSYRVTGLSLGDTAYFYLSTRSTLAGAGPCPPQFGGVCGDLRSPRALGNDAANASGIAKVNVNLPASLQADQLLNVQALILRPNGATLVTSIWTDHVEVDQDLDGYTHVDDCDDTDPTVSPGAPEICDGRDNDCDGAVDNGCGGGADADADGLSDADEQAFGTDPNNADTDNDGLGDGDEVLVWGTSPLDADTDADGDTDGAEVSCQSNPLDPTDTCAGGNDLDNDGFPSPQDCNDTDPSIHPAAAEITGDGIDQNCDGRELCFADLDNDGARTTSTLQSTDLDCVDAGEGRASDPLDCNDTDASISPMAGEVAGNSVDNDCDGRELCYGDADNDGARTTTTFLTGSGDTTCLGPNEGAAADPIDCDDANPTRSPLAQEVCGDLIDNNCDGQIDEGCP